MAAIVKNGKPSVGSVLPPANQKITGLHVGEDIAAGDACRIGSDGLIYRASGAATGANAQIAGFAARDALFAQNAALTLYTWANWGYGKGLTPGTRVYLSGTVAGGLDNAASTGGTAPCGLVLDDARIFLKATLV